MARLDGAVAVIASGAKQSRERRAPTFPDCFVAALLAMTIPPECAMLNAPCSKSSRTTWGWCSRRPPRSAALLGLFGRGAENMPVCAVKNRVGGGRPFCVGRQRAPTLKDSPRLQFALRGLLVRHGDEVERRLFGHDEDLRKRFAGPENMGLALGRRFEDQEKDHRPPAADEGRDRDRRGVCRVGVETRVWLETNRPALLHLEVKRQLIGVVKIAE